MTYFDLCGCVLFPGSSNVHAEFDVRHDWHGCPSSHLIRRRLCSPAPSARVRILRTSVLTDNGRTPYNPASSSASSRVQSGGRMEEGKEGRRRTCSA